MKDVSVWRERKSLNLVMLLPLFVWIIAIFPKTIQLFIYVIFALAVCLRYGKLVFVNQELTSVEYAFAAFLAIYILSIGANAQNSVQDRVLAAANTAMCWFLSLIFYFVYRWIGKHHQTVNLGIVSFINVSILVFLALLYYANLKLPFNLGDRVLYGTDWTNGQESKRFFAYLEYANLSIALLLMFFPVSVYFVVRRFPRYVGYLYCASTLLPAFASGSRSGIILVSILALAGYIYIKNHSSRPIFSSKLRFLIAALITVIFVLLFSRRIANLLVEIFESRQGSNNLRFALYKYSVGQVLSRSPIFGLGIKEIAQQFGPAVPVGSHSTYIGVLFRVGLLGFTVFMYGLLALFNKILSSVKENWLILIALIAFALFLLTEDIDGADWLLISTSVLLGLLPGYLHECGVYDG